MSHHSAAKGGIIRGRVTKLNQSSAAVHGSRDALFLTTPQRRTGSPSRAAVARNGVEEARKSTLFEFTMPQSRASGAGDPHKTVGAPSFAALH